MKAFLLPLWRCPGIREHLLAAFQATTVLSQHGSGASPADRVRGGYRRHILRCRLCGLLPCTRAWTLVSRSQAATKKQLCVSLDKSRPIQHFQKREWGEAKLISEFLNLSSLKGRAAVARQALCKRLFSVPPGPQCNIHTHSKSLPPAHTFFPQSALQVYYVPV